MHAAGEDGLEVAIREVGAGVADLVGGPAVAHRPLQLPGEHTSIPTNGNVLAKEPQQGGVTLGLERQANHPAEPRSLERVAERRRLLGDVPEVVHVQRRAMGAGEVLRVASSDTKAPGPDLQSGPGPTRSAPRARASARRYRAYHSFGRGGGVLTLRLGLGSAFRLVGFDRGLEGQEPRTHPQQTAECSTARAPCRFPLRR